MRSLRQHLPNGTSTANDTQIGDKSPRNLTLKVPRATPTPSQRSPRGNSRQRAGLHSPLNSPIFRPSPTLQANSVNYISDSRMSASALTWRGYARRTTPIHTTASSDDAVKLRELIVGMFGEFSANRYSSVIGSRVKDSTIDMLSQFQLPPANVDYNIGAHSPNNPSTTRTIETTVNAPLEPIVGLMNGEQQTSSRHSSKLPSNLLRAPSPAPWTDVDPFSKFQRSGSHSPSISDVEGGEGYRKSARLPPINSPASSDPFVPANPNQHIADYLDFLFDADGQTPIFISIAKGNLNVFRLLAYDIGCICPPPPHTLDAVQGMASVDTMASLADNVLRASEYSAQGLDTSQGQFISIAGQSSSAGTGTGGSISGGPNNQLFQISASSLTPRMQSTTNFSPHTQAPPVMLTKHEGRTALHCAAYLGNVEILTYLLTTCGWGWDRVGGLPARTETLSTGGESALGAGCSYSSIPTLGSDAKRTALHCAVASRQIECVRALAEAGCNLNARDGSGHTALIIAVAQGDREMTAMLLSLRGGHQRYSLPPLKSQGSTSRSSITSIDITGGLLGNALLLNRPSLDGQPSFQFPFSTQACDPFATTRSGYTAVRLGAQRGMQDLFIHHQL
eukprot:GILJ01021133.1.p1 GENE.GILJ01021133.1~~GILJ01021133.1.p1  ORF type:complete len:621 (-),score=37.11 GILJ01021133.1:322-2184(-)